MRRMTGSDTHPTNSNPDKEWQENLKNATSQHGASLVEWVAINYNCVLSCVNYIEANDNRSTHIPRENCASRNCGTDLHREYLPLRASVASLQGQNGHYLLWRTDCNPEYLKISWPSVALENVTYLRDGSKCPQRLEVRHCTHDRCMTG